MSFDAKALYDLLPAVVRIRDGEQGEPLRAVLAVIAEQVAVIEENLEQLYDDQFIETCAEWVVPYIGELIGYRALHGVVPEIASPRAEVANTIAFRRRKGTAAMLEQLARDITGWPARVVEFFELLCATQSMNHLRPHALHTAPVRGWRALERLGSAFDPLAHSVDVRRISTGAGRYNIPNIGIFLWRLQAYRIEDSPAVPAAPGDAQRFLFSPLGTNAPLFSRPEREARISHLAEPRNVPLPIGRRVLDADLAAYYGEGLSLAVRENGTLLPAAAVRVCDLSDIGGGNWAGQPATGIAVDPVLGRIAFAEAPDPLAGRAVAVSFHYGFGADLGGGPYERAASFSQLAAGQALVRVPDSQPSIAAALAALPPAGGIVEITDNGRYAEALQVSVGSGAAVEIRAANGRRPTLVLPGALEVSGGAGATVLLNGLLVTSSAAPSGAPTGLVHVPAAAANALRALTLRHCTLVPGWALSIGGAPQHPAEPCVVIEPGGVAVEIEHCILGPLRIDAAASAQVTESIIDASDPGSVAYAAVDGVDAGGALTLADCTVIGRIHAAALPLVSNSILDARAAASAPPVRALRRQEGCVRFSLVPMEAIVPRRYRCQPDLAITAAIEEIEARTGAPVGEAVRQGIRGRLARSLLASFTSRRYGDPGYGQLRRSAPLAIRTGAEDEAEMGAFHRLFQPQRETNLRIRLDEYLRFGLEAGVFYET